MLSDSQSKSIIYDVSTFFSSRLDCDIVGLPGARFMEPTSLVLCMGTIYSRTPKTTASRVFNLSIAHFEMHVSKSRPWTISYANLRWEVGGKGGISGVVVLIASATVVFD